MSAAVTALIAGTIGGVLYYYGLLPRVVALLAMVVGLGVNGWTGDWLHKAGAWTGNQLSHWTTKAVGAGLPGILALVLLMIVVIQLVPKLGSPNRFTPACALALVVMLPLLGGAAGTASNQAVSWLGNGAATAATALFGGGA
jgi:hypothetical protein